MPFVAQRPKANSWEREGGDRRREVKEGGPAVCVGKASMPDE